jgi:hypothetical protein
MKRLEMHNLSGRNLKHSILLGLLCGMGIALIFTAGFFFREIVGLPMRVSASASAEESYPLLDEVQGLLNRHYVRQQPDFIARQYAAVRGMLASLEDPYTFFIDPRLPSRSDRGTMELVYGSAQRARTSVFPFEDGPVGGWE